MKSNLTGKKAIVPMVSPFNSDFTIDVTAVERMGDFFIKAGVSVFVLGTTGEGESMSGEQREALLRSVVKTVKHRSEIYAGLSGNSLSESVKDAMKYTDLGADFLVARIPSYYPLDENQMLHYFEKLAGAVTIPLFLYNIPVTTYHSIPLNIINQLSHHPNIHGLKDSEKNADRLDEALRLWGQRDDFDYLVGWAAMSSYGLSGGAGGIVPSTGNICPGLYVQMIDAVREGDSAKVAELQKKTDRISALYQKGRNLSQSIAALKILMKRKGLCNSAVLPPLTTLTEEEEKIFFGEIENDLDYLNM